MFKTSSIRPAALTEHQLETDRQTQRDRQWATARTHSSIASHGIRLTVISRPLVSIGSRIDTMPATMAIALYIDIATWTDTRSSTCTHRNTHARTQP